MNVYVIFAMTWTHYTHVNEDTGTKHTIINTIHTDRCDAHTHSKMQTHKDTKNTEWHTHTDTHPPPLQRDGQPSALWSSNNTTTRSEESTTETLLPWKVHWLPFAAKLPWQTRCTLHVHCIRGSYCLNKHCRTDDSITWGWCQQYIPMVSTAMTFKKS